MVAWGLSRAAPLVAEFEDMTQALEDQAGIAFAHMGQGLIALEKRDYALARERLEAALSYLREQGDQFYTAIGVLNLGRLALIQGNSTRRCSCWRKAWRPHERQVIR